MAVTIDSVYIETFEQNLRHLAQQSDSKLRARVMERSTTGEKHNWERLAPSAAVQKTTVLADTPVAEVAWSRRQTLAETWHAGEATEQEDPVQMLVDPNSNLARNLSMGMKRAVDDLIIAAATGASRDGAGAGVAFPAAQKLGDGTTPISFDFVTQVQEKFMENEIDADVPKCFVVGPAQIRKLMQLTEQTSNDYVRKRLDELSATGICPNWMGFDWLMSNRLNSPGAGQTDCFAMTYDAIGLQVNRDISARIAEDPTKSFAWRIYSFMTMGAIRVEDEQLVHLHVLN